MKPSFIFENLFRFCFTIKDWFSHKASFQAAAPY